MIACPTPPKARSLRSRLTAGTLWSAIGAIGTQGGGLAASVFAARWLGKQHFGELAMINSTIGSFGVFAGLGIGMTATKYVAEHRSANPARAARIIGLSMLVSALSGILLAAALAVGAQQLAAGMLRAPALAHVLQAGALLLLFSTLTSTQIGCLSGFEAFKQIAKISVVQAAATLPLTIVGIVLFGLTGAVWGAIAGAACGLMVGSASLRKRLRALGARVRLRDALSEWRVLFAFSVPAFLATIMVSPVLWLANTMLTRRADGYLELAVLNAANQWRNMALFLPTLLSQVTLPLLASSLGQRTRDSEYGKTLELTQAATVLIVFPFSALIMFSAGPIMRLYGKSFGDGDHVFIAVCLTVMIIAVGSCTGPAIQAHGRMWLGLFINAFWGIALLTSVHFTAWRYGALSLAYSGAAAYLLTTLLTIWWVRENIPAAVVRRTMWLLGVAVVMTLAASVTPADLRLGLAAPAFSVTLAALLAFLLPPGSLARAREFAFGPK